MGVRLLVVLTAVLVSVEILASGLMAHALMARMGCLVLPRNSVPVRDPKSDPGVVRFVALGDTGTGSPIQRRTAAAARKVCRSRGCQFAVLLGDNFYPKGMDPGDRGQFRRLVLRPYKKLKMPLYAVLGNHDLDRNPIHQVRASRRHKRWNMPNFRYGFHAGPAAFHATNSNCGGLEWWRLSDSLQRKPGLWNVVLSHHPPYSHGPHGEMNWLDGAVWRWLVEDRTDLVLSGHNHMIEHLRRKGRAQEYFVLGSSGGNREKRRTEEASGAERLFDSSEAGFGWFEIRPDSLRAEIYNDRGRRIYGYESKR